MFKLLCVGLAVVLVANATPVKNMRPGFGRIVGGEDTTIEEYPYQVSLQYYGSHICGGSVVANNYVITAGHCTDGSSANSLTVRAGSGLLETGGVVVSLRDYVQNPDYDYFTTDYDVSVLVLAEDLVYGSTIQPIALPARELPDGTTVNVSGWGTLHEGDADLPEVLQAVSVDIVSRATCNRAYSAIGWDVTNRMICAASPQGGKDSCQGDSGGPLSSDNTLYGIVSWGLGCAEDGYPGVYSSVADAEMREFIAGVTGL